MLECTRKSDGSQQLYFPHYLVVPNAMLGFDMEKGGTEPKLTILKHDNCPRCSKALVLNVDMPNLYQNKYCPDKNCG